MVNVQFPHLILKTLYVNQSVRNRVTPYLSADWFRENQNISTIITKILEYMEKFGQFPTVIESRMMLRTDASILEEFDAAMGIPEEEACTEFILQDIEQFIRQKLLYDATVKIQEALFSHSEPTSDEGSFAQMVADAESFTFDTDIGFDLVEDLDKVYEEMITAVSIIPSGIKEIDTLLNGGVPDKVMIGIMAPTNVGKTLIMSALASNMLTQGHNVLYITFEDSKTKIATRMMQNLCDISQEQLKMLNRNSFIALKDMMKKKSSQHLKIAEMEECTVNAMRIRTLLKDLKEKKHFEPEIIFIDYIGCMIPNGRPNPNLNSNTILQKVAAETRGSICMKLGIPIVTALQTNRGGYGSASVDLNDVADSYGSTMKLDAILAVTQDQTMLQNGMYKIKVAKTRIKNNKGTEVMIGVSIDKQQIYDLNGSTPSVGSTPVAPAATPSLTDTATITVPQAPSSGAPTHAVEIEPNKDVAENAYVASAKVDLDKINSIL
jgi:archaellum biogenesis ATPase FlaH